MSRIARYRASRHWSPMAYAAALAVLAAVVVANVHIGRVAMVLGLGARDSAWFLQFTTVAFFAIHVLCALGGFVLVLARRPGAALGVALLAVPLCFGAAMLAV